MPLPSISCIALGIADLTRSKRLYAEGFGWKPVFENEEIAFYQMNGLMIGTWLKEKLIEDKQAPSCPASGGVTRAHNVDDKDSVDPLLEKLIAVGGTLLRPADDPFHGGRRGYVADPDGHACESPGTKNDRWMREAMSPSACERRLQRSPDHHSVASCSRFSGSASLLLPLA